MTLVATKPLALPYGDPNQPYDRLPGTLETYHVKWARPLSEGKLKVLVIIPYMNSRQVVELAQRLDIEYTVIMNAGQALWSRGRFEGSSATPIHGPDAEVLLHKLSHERLDPARQYDAIVIAKVSWEVIPPDVRGMILTHVERGTGLVYVSPNRLAEGLQTTEEADAPDRRFEALFGANEDPGACGAITDGLPMDLLPFKLVADREDFDKLRPIRCDEGSYPRQSALNIRASHHGSGRVVSLDYFDGKWGRGLPDSLGEMMSPETCHYPKTGIGNHNSLSPEILYDDVVYDYSFALLARCVLYSIGRTPPVRARVSFDAPPTDLACPVDDRLKDYRWRINTPDVVIARDDLPRTKALLKITTLDGSPEAVKLDYAVRNAKGDALRSGKRDVKAAGGPTSIHEVSLPALRRGNYTLDLRVLDSEGKVLEFASKSFRVEDRARITKIETDKGAYEKGDVIQGGVCFSRALRAGQSAAARAVDTWGRTVFRTPVKMNSQGTAGSFSIPVELPLCRLWDIHCTVRDADGEVDSAKVWVGLPDWNFDEYIWALIFAPHPEHDWKGRLYASAIRPYGVNATNAYLICGEAKLFEWELNERHHLYSIAYAEDHGSDIGENDQFEKRQRAVEELLGLPRAVVDYEKECSESCPAQFARMARHIADTGEPLDPREFPYKAGFGSWVLDARRINDRLRSYLESAKFGSPYYWLCGEAYQWGEMQGRENGCFCPLCTKNFQDWAREQYHDDLDALNAEWGSEFTSWNQVRGILYRRAKRNNQLPRWVDFRHFMRSRVWSRFFIDWTDMIRRYVPQARTGYNGHDHYDLSRFRNHMTSGKMYVTPSLGLNCEWRICAVGELHQSFSGDRSFLVAANSMIRWHNDFDIPIERKRYPWKMLLAGYRGFDWEEGLSFQTLGGENCFTPDYSEPLEFFKDLSDEVLYLQRGIGKLINTAAPKRDPVAILWAPYNHYVSRLHPFEANGFTGTELYNIVVDNGAITDCLVLLKSLRLRPTFVAPEDLANGGLEERGFKALLLPYNKGMSQGEADAIREFVKDGGLVIADNTPGICSEHGRELQTPRLADLFPVTDAEHVVLFGKGAAVYLPNGINYYLGRMERCEYAGSDSVAMLLKELAGVTPTVELIDAHGAPRRDTLAPIYVKGSALYVGMLRNSLSDGMEPNATTVRLDARHHVWDVREQKYHGCVDTFEIDLDMRARLFALLAANPVKFELQPVRRNVRQGETLRCTARVEFEGGDEEQIARMGQVAHVEVVGPAGDQLEWYRDNILFDGREFEIELPISYSEQPGLYIINAEHTVTGMIARAEFEVNDNRQRHSATEARE